MFGLGSLLNAGKFIGRGILGGGGNGGVTFGSAAGNMGSGSSGFSGGLLGRLLGGIGGAIKKNPLESAMMAGSIYGSRQNRGLNEAQKRLYELEARKREDQARMRQAAMPMLLKLMAQGPYSSNMPDISELLRSFGGNQTVQ